MNIFDLVSAEEIDNLPDEPRQAFADFTRHAYRRLTEKISTLDLSENYGWQEANEARAGFMNVIVAASRRFEIQPFCLMEVPKIAEVGEAEYNQFKADLDHYITQIVLDASIKKRSDSVEIGEDAKSKIRSYLHGIKQTIDNGGFSDTQKRSLLDKIAEFEKSLDGRKMPLINLAYLVLTLTTIPGGVAQTGDLISPLVSKIVRTIEAERQIEDRRRSVPRSQEPKVLIAPRTTTAIASTSIVTFGSSVLAKDEGDDIPF